MIRGNGFKLQKDVVQLSIERREFKLLEGEMIHHLSAGFRGKKQVNHHLKRIQILLCDLLMYHCWAAYY